MENLRKKNHKEILEIKNLFIQTRSTVEGHSSNLKQGEYRISMLKDEIEIKEVLVKQHKSCERNMKKLSDCIKRPHLRIMGIEEGEKVHNKRICNIFNKIIKDSSAKLCYPFRNRNTPGHKTDLTKIKPPHSILSLKQQVQRTKNEF
jgi:hypothetical protein